jgi:hypothetical protein
MDATTNDRTAEDGPRDEERAAELVAEEGGAEEEAEHRYETEPAPAGADAGRGPNAPRDADRRPVAADVERGAGPDLAEGPTGPLEAETSGTGVGSNGPE